MNNTFSQYTGGEDAGSKAVDLLQKQVCGVLRSYSVSHSLTSSVLLVYTLSPAWLHFRHSKFQSQTAKPHSINLIFSKQ